ncbi:hypothetical protein DICSQDRAFT_159138 [Dichomitus squalens LYAD-421 SS1]|uniref:uncharacterized protein n=1 Tax=Dichomitus squalens (strain LYAD-421) TaxID=732165 RepID=UPI0004413845|nr:uncharacterized protein DICSQDRAFT_159138 [Dichomitus squalens LYAD-421 SS1]EJF66097.1 hypothetical protein DICSQDRAFT_159138 [Dichomitus squalens LYAD-421 SS1]
MNQYPDHWLESPPPPSRFRRPWSPDPYDPLPASSNLNRHDENPYQSVGQWAVERRREPSDVSVEALDLADYARTLNRNNANHHFSQQPPYNPYDPYPPSPRSNRPLARNDSLSPPSLTSAASASSSQSYRSPLRRPFSLPPPSSYPGHSHGSHPSQRTRHEPQIASPSSEIDIAHFPSFTRGWYAPDNASPFSPPGSSQGHGHGGDDRTKRNPFDPSYTLDRDPFSDPYNPSPPPSYPYGSSFGPHSRSSRDHNLVPWSADPDERAVDPEIKEERMRMLEREFGKNTAKDAPPERTVGSVDPQGRLITEGPKKRLAVRCLQVFLALTAAITSIYSGLIIKPNPAAPPAGKLPAYVLYIMSFLTFIGCSFFFLIYPCCCGARKPKDSPFTGGPGGMMVLPVGGFPGQRPKKKGKKGKGSPESNVQVNLIVDPTMFGRDPERAQDDEEDEEEDGSSAVPGSYSGASSAARRRGQPRRRGIFAGLAMEEQWKRARKTLKWGVTIDALLMLVWGMEFVLILLGKRCPVGGYLGWCDAYNIGTAAACLMCLLFGISIFFDVKDLHASRASPRTRT